MQSKYAILQVENFPLNQKILVEASAGTGKTYAIVELYLRLLLNVGKNKPSRALKIEEILVVTFTKVATAELKERIRIRITEIRNLINQQIINSKTIDILQDDNDKFILQELIATNKLETSKIILNLSEQNIDLAAIYTIDGFCQQSLIRYAFDSGINFDFDLIADTGKINLQLIEKFWREKFYPLNIDLSAVISSLLVSPDAIYSQLISLMTKKNKIVLSDEFSVLSSSIEEYLARDITAFIQLTNKIKQQWILKQPTIAEQLAKAIAENKIDKRSYQERHLASRYIAIKNWCEELYDYNIIEKLSYFAFDKINAKSLSTDKTEFFTDEIYHDIQTLFTYSTDFMRQSLLWYCFKFLQQELPLYLNQHNYQTFDSLLNKLNDALQFSDNNRLVKIIRQQYPFAMIDEFQDTDLIQYSIFKQIYIDADIEKQEIIGFTMIGDPKQSIYAFRGADIFAYLKAQQQTQNIYSMDTNWRSNDHIVQGINQLFNFNNSFIYSDIQYQKVQSAPQNANTFVEVNAKKSASLKFYKLEESGTKEQLRLGMAKICANNIAALLNHANNITIKSKSVKPTDIAILVRSKKEAEIIKQALMQVNIASVFLSDRNNVFASFEAKEILYILRACLEYQNKNYVLAAIGTSILALTAVEIDNIQKSEELWEDWINKFFTYRNLWQQQGILVMIHSLLFKEQIPQKHYASISYERKLTNIRHVAELLQTQMAVEQSMYALLQWLEQSIMQSDQVEISEYQQIRLESEKALVQIVTFHKAKGLQYPIVWLPFILIPSNIRKNRKVLLTHDLTSHKLIWVHVDDSLLKMSEQEEQAEEIRLLYVAMTRAQFQLNIVLPNLSSKAINIFNSFLFLLQQNQEATKKMEGELAIEKLISNIFANVHYEIINKHYVENSIKGKTNADIANYTKEKLNIYEFHGKLEKNWNLTSFSSFFDSMDYLKINLHDSAMLLLNSKGIDEVRDNKDDLLFNEETGKILQYNQFSLPKGATVGIALHSILENHDFTQPISQQTCKDLLDKLGLEQELWLTVICNWFNDNILTTPINKYGTCLKGISRQNSIKELQFFLSIKSSVNIEKFIKLLQKYEPSMQDMKIKFYSLKGMLQGFIDLIIKIDDQFYLIDYKSNFLGDSYDSYQRDNLQAEIIKHRYDLQYILYTLALHRYLKMKMTDYDYDKHFAGVIYLFMRGMNGKDMSTGVFSHKPDFELIDGLDKLFAGE